MINLNSKKLSFSLIVILVFGCLIFLIRFKSINGGPEILKKADNYSYYIDVANNLARWNTKDSTVHLKYIEVIYTTTTKDIVYGIYYYQSKLSGNAAICLNLTSGDVVANLPKEIKVEYSDSMDFLSDLDKKGLDAISDKLALQGKYFKKIYIYSKSGSFYYQPDLGIK